MVVGCFFVLFLLLFFFFFFPGMSVADCLCRTLTKKKKKKSWRKKKEKKKKEKEKGEEIKEMKSRVREGRGRCVSFPPGNQSLPRACSHQLLQSNVPRGRVRKGTRFYFFREASASSFWDRGTPAGPCQSLLPCWHSPCRMLYVVITDAAVMSEPPA